MKNIFIFLYFVIIFLNSQHKRRILECQLGKEDLVGDFDKVGHHGWGLKQ